MIEQMKPSGIDWIKDIPYSWHTNKVKYLATESGTLFLDGDWIESDVIEESGIRYLTTGNVGAGYYKEQGSGYISEKTFSDLHCLKVYPGDLMISRLNEPIGRACIVPEGEDFYVVAVDNVILRPNKAYNKKFIMYAMNTEGYAEHGNMIARGATMSRVSRSQLGQFWIAAPNLSEQTAIAEFLDVQCSKLDSIIADLEKQIDTLQKYKKSLITETVTKGLDKSAPMKDSGIEWIGLIPEHWSVKRLKFMLESGSESMKVGPFGSALSGSDIIDEGKWVYNQRTVLDDNFTENTAFISEEKFKEMRGFAVNAGDILITTRGTIGKVAIVPDPCEEGILHPCIIKFRVNDSLILPELLKIIFNESDFVKDQFTLMSNATTIEVIYSYSLKDVILPVIPTEEQKGIYSYLKEKCETIDDVLKTKKSELEHIQQHKKSLIYEYVTGKKRITEVK